MILRDRVDVLDATGNVVRSDVPAYVGSARTVLVDGYSVPVGTKEDMTCVLPADVEIPDRNGLSDYQIRWRGRVYHISQPPMIRRQHGRDHHQTVGLNRFS